VLPVPLHGAVASLELDERARWLAREPAALLLADEDVDVDYRVTLGEVPAFADEDGAADGLPAELFAPTAPDGELPPEAHDLLARLAAAEVGPVSRALEVRDFVRTNYRYDPSYLEDGELARWLERLTRGRQNVHLALLHASRDGRSLGGGVCYELNVLVCELLRRTGVPAAVATGWLLDEGALSEPDHLWAMALLPTTAGPRWRALDAASTQSGRPLRVPRRPAGAWRVGEAARLRPPAAPDLEARRARPQAPTELALRAGDLARVIEFVQAPAGTAAPGALRRRCRELLEQPEARRRLLARLEQAPPGDFHPRE
jgi:hypothetical protein